MIEEKEPDYSTYTLDELLEVIDYIDKKSYPDRVKKVLYEIEQRRTGVPAKEKEKGLREKSPPIFEFTLPKKLKKEQLFMLGVLSIFNLASFQLDQIALKGFAVSRIEHPGLFFAIVILVNALMILLLFVKEDN